MSADRHGNIALRGGLEAPLRNGGNRVSIEACVNALNDIDVFDDSVGVDGEGEQHHTLNLLAGRFFRILWLNLVNYSREPFDGGEW